MFNIKQWKHIRYNDTKDTMLYFATNNNVQTKLKSIQNIYVTLLYFFIYFSITAR